MHRRAFLTSTAGLSAVALAGCLGTSREQASYDIGMSSNAFLPQEDFEPRVGKPVVWRNTGSRMHTVTAYESGIPERAAYFASGGFRNEQAARDGWVGGTNGGIAGGETYEHTFEVPGTYNYFCIPHERGGMVGTFTVVK